MTRSVALCGLVLVAWLAGCNRDSAPTICSGDEEITLAVSYRGGPNVELGAQLMTELGTQYFYVAGTCEYWALAYSDDTPWPRARHGVLPRSEARRISEELFYDSFAENAGCYWSGGSEGAGVLWHDDSRSIFCEGDCSGAPEAVRLMHEQSNATIRSAYDEGDADVPRLRIAVPPPYQDPDDGYVDSLAIPWPLAWPLDSAVEEIAPGDLGVGTLITDAADVQSLRELAEVRVDTLRVRGALVFQAAPGAPVYSVWLRDALPIEDERGLVPGPDACEFPGCC